MRGFYFHAASQWEVRYKACRTKKNATFITCIYVHLFLVTGWSVLKCAKCAACHVIKKQESAKFTVLKTFPWQYVMQAPSSGLCYRAIPLTKMIVKHWLIFYSSFSTEGISKSTGKYVNYNNKYTQEQLHKLSFINTIIFKFLHS